MSLKLKDWAKSDAGSANLSRSHLEDSSDDDISYLPPGSMRQKEQRKDDDDRPQYAEVPRMKDEKPWFGPTDRDGSIKVKYPSINGYGVDSDQLQQMEKMGLPTGFTFGQTQPERQRKGDKKSFYCEICLVELNSLETMKSHVAGIKHMKKKLQLDQRKDEQLRRGEISEEQLKSGPGVIPVPNPVSTKIKVPVRLHEKIKAATEPVVGLDFVQEWIAVSDPEMEPHYECSLCGSKGIANGMFSHIMGYKHRQMFIEEIYKESNLAEVLDLSQSQLLDYARKHAENGDNLNEKIKTRRSDEEYPWPAGKAPWSIERGGTGIPPDRARENWGKNDEYFEEKLSVGNGRERKRERAGRSEEVSRRSCLPSVSSLRRPMEQEEALQMLSLAEKLIEYSLDFLEPKISPQEHSVLKLTTSSICSKIVHARRQTSNGQDPPRERSMSNSSNGHRKRSRTPPLPPPVKRERRSPSYSRPGPSKSYYAHDDRDRFGGGRSRHEGERERSYRRDRDQGWRGGRF